MFTFLTPLFLIGMFAAAIPLIVHLSRSRRTQKMQFSTTRFFTDQFLRSYRMSRLRELLLLITRMALFALFAMALAQPIFMPKGRSFLRGKRSIVLVIDNSASMGYVENGVSLLDRACSIARELLDGLRPGDAASVVLASRRSTGPEVLFPEPTTALGDVRQAIGGLQVSTLGTDLSGAIDRAERIAGAGSAQSREVYVLSDLQDSGWELPDETIKPQTDSEVLFFLVSVRSKTLENVSIAALQYVAARPMPGIPFSLRAHVFNQGDQVRAAEIMLYVDGLKVAQQRLDNLQPGRWAVPLFRHTFRNGGWHTGYVELQDQTFAADNRRYFAFEVMDSIKVLAINGAPSHVARLDELFFLKTALTADPGGGNPIRLDIVVPADLDGKDISAYPLIILANVESLAPSAIEKLEEFVDHGGSLFVFLGDKVNAAFYNENLASLTRLHGGLMPGRLVGIEGDPSGERHSAFIASVDYKNAALAVFQDPGFAMLSDVTFKALWGVEPHDCTVLMRADTGWPLLCEKIFGKGRVLLFAGTCDRDWTDFPVRPAFLPWIYRLVAYLVQEPMGRNAFYITGQRVPLQVSSMEGMTPVLVKMPDGTIGHATASDDPNIPFGFADTTQMGVYSLYSPGEGTGVSRRAEQFFVANLESYESDLTYLDDVLVNREGAGKSFSRTAKIESGFKELMPGRPLVTYVDNPAQVIEASLSARRGIKLWDMMLLVVLIIALIEPWLANRISLRHYVRPTQVPDVRESVVRTQ